MKRPIKIFVILVCLLLIGLLLKNLIDKPREIKFDDAIIYGNVKSIKEISYKAKLRNGNIVKIKRWRRGHLTDDFHCFFDKKGELIKKIIYPAQDTGTTNYEVLYKYNTKRQLTNEYFKDEKPEKPEYFYNKLGQLIREEYSLSNIEYDYYPNGKIHHKTQVDHEIGKEFLYTFAYKNNFIKYKDTYYFGAGWHLIEQYERDGSGNCTKYKIVSSFKELSKEKWDEYQYEFDRQDNWIKCIHYRYNKPIFIIERVIEYY